MFNRPYALPVTHPTVTKRRRNKLCAWRHTMPPTPCKLTISLHLFARWRCCSHNFAVIRQVAPVPACWLFKTSATSWPLTFWPWKWRPSHVWSGLPLCQFSLPRPLCCRVRPDVRRWINDGVCDAWPVQRQTACRRLEKISLPSIFDTSLILHEVKLAELSNNSFEWKNATFLGVGSKHTVTPPAYFQGSQTATCTI